MKRLAMKVILTGIFTLASVLAVQGGIIDENSARLIAFDFINSRALCKDDASSHSIKLAHTQLSDNLKIPAYYVFNIDSDGGWIIVAGDDRSKHVLGYSKTGRFDPQNMPENRRTWFDGYCRQMEYLNQHPKLQPTTPAFRASNRENIEPMLVTKWHQSYPYNKYCPNGTVGCTITAATQVMYYYQWPQDSIPEIPGYTTYNDQTFPSLPPTIFNWDLMLPEYKSGEYTTENADAVAVLAHYVGKSFQAWYSSTYTIANFSNAVKALIQYYDYDASINYLYRDNYVYETWEEMVYQEIRQHRPVVYSGVQKQQYIGHAFIFDGYEDGYFHANWGGGGNGEYVTLDACPGDYGYNRDQDMIMNMKPNEGGLPQFNIFMLTLLSPLNTSVNSAINVKTGIGIYVNPYFYHTQLVPVNKTSGEPLFINQEIHDRYSGGYDTLSISLPTGFPEGLYELKVLLNRSEDGTEGSWEEGVRGDALPRLQMLVAGNYVKLGLVAPSDPDLALSIDDVTWIIDAILAGDETLTIDDVTTVIDVLLGKHS
jgi:hypothetical protein